MSRRIVASLTDLRRAPGPDAALDTQAIEGETVEVLDEAGAYLRVRLADGYEGFVPAADVGAASPAPTHRVAVARSLAFPVADFKRPPIGHVLMGAAIAIARIEGRYAVDAAGRHLIAAHLQPVGTVETDPVAVAERFIGTPYLWGGKSALGLDCSGLVQIAYAACGIALPRDSGPQERCGVGVALPPDSALRRGDLVFWKGHVAIARGDGTILHANAHHMMVAIEDARAAVARIAAAGDPVTAIRRIAPNAA